MYRTYSVLDVNLPSDVPNSPYEIEAQHHEEAAAICFHNWHDGDSDIVSGKVRVTDPDGVSKLFEVTGEYSIDFYCEEIEDSEVKD